VSDPLLIGTIGIVILLVVFALGIPIAFTMAIVGMIGFAYMVSPAAGLNLLPRDIYEQFASYPLTVIPMFVMMGCYAFASGIGKKLFDTAYVIMGQLPGGLAIAAIAACTGFGAVCGSTAATCATIGKIALPEMKRYSYSDTLATGTLAVGGSLGIMIPPSTSFAVYGILTEQSIGKLFISGVIPGLIIAVLFIITIFIICRRDPGAGPPGPHTSWTLKLKSLSGLISTVILFLVTLGGLFGGWFTPTQSGAIGSVGALLIGLITRDLNWQKFIEATRDGLRISCMIMLLIAGAIVFGHFIARTTMPFFLSSWVTSQGFSPLMVMALVVIFYFILGFFIDAMALIVLLMPILFPMVVKLGFDPIWFGTMVTLLSMTAVVTPPVAVNMYVVKSIAKEVPLEIIAKGIFPFLIPFFIAIVLLIAFPEIATFLPSKISY
jgi:C4-dicarboxylate transporter DctM subunit